MTGLIGSTAPAFAQTDELSSVPIQIVTAQDIERLPTCGRALLDIVQLPPAPALHVSKGEVRIRGRENDAFLVDGLDVRDSTGTVRPASELLCFDDLEVMRQPLEILQGDRVAGVINIVTRPPAQPLSRPLGLLDSTFYAEPLLIPGQMQVIRGPFGAGGSDTRVEAGGRPGVVVTKTPDALYFTLPPDLPHGAVSITLTESGEQFTFPVHVLGLAMSAERLKLMRGESTKLEVSVFGPELMPVSAWTAGDMSATIDLAKVAELFPGFRVPKPGEPASIFLRVDNATRDTVTMTPSRNESFFIRLERSHFAAGAYTYRGVVRSRRAGSFTINALVVGFFAPVAGSPVR